MNSKVTIKLFLLSSSQNNQKPQNDTVEPIVEVIGALFDKEYRFAQFL
ncbi:6864_t:CDS:2 [Entrophospora sp. SA101]|nr:6864_t:CDS:2 [Entrophospora sp. SA101]